MYGDPVKLAERLVSAARDEGRHALLEMDAFQVVDALGIRIPRRVFVRHPGEIEHLRTTALASDRLVVKVVAPSVAHKSDLGGVVVVPNHREALTAAVEEMEHAFERVDVAGYSIAEFVQHDASLGGEWLLGLRWTDEFGAVVTVGAGGVATEFLCSVLQPGRDVAVLAPRGLTRSAIENGLQRLAVSSLATGAIRRQPARASLEAIVSTVERFSRLAAACRPDCLVEFEINPLVATGGHLVALDVLATIGDRAVAIAPSRPVRKIANLLTPRSIAVMGVSSQTNPGRVILQNLLREGFDPSAITVVKPGVEEIDGCRAVPGIRMLPAPVDLLILSVSAAQVPEALIDVTVSRNAESVIVIPGGLEEKAGTSGLVTQMRDTLARARDTEWRGPVVNGGNCLGVRSRPGRYDTMFIPAHKLRPSAVPEAPLAILSQSGAFAVSRATWLSGLDPRYSITVGNQMDLTIGDYLAYLESDPILKVFAIYVEGFKTLDGRATLDAVERITAGGRTVILYRAGRTPDGRRATASHTAAVAGDYAVTRDLFRAAGAVVAETLEDFTDLVMLFTLLRTKAVAGRRIGAMSNAGYECVALADALGELELPSFTPATTAHLEAVLERSRLSGIVDVHNPLDVTPMMDDAAFEAAARAVLEDPHVDVGVVGCVPATPALTTLPGGAAHQEDLARPEALAARLLRLTQATAKPLVAIVDAGALYDPLAQRLLEGGIPTFRSADRAMRLLNVFVEDRFAHTVRAAMERWVDEFSLPATFRERTPLVD